MRTILLLGLLMMGVAACSQVFAPNDDETPAGETPAGLSLAPRNPSIPANEDGDLACPGGFAKGSRIDEYRDGSANLFCD